MRMRRRAGRDGGSAVGRANGRLGLVAAVLAVAVTVSGLPGASAPAPVRGDCDPLDPSLCMLPFPNDRFTAPDAGTDTGLRVDLRPTETPRSIAGKPIDVSELNRNDGFSPGSMVLTFVPGLDLHRTWGTHDLDAPGVGGPTDARDHIADIRRYERPDAPILLIDSQTGERHPFWSELDEHPDTAEDERLLILRPAVNLAEGHRYLVALRNMREADGDVVPAGAHFAAYRDGTVGPTGDPTFEELRRAEVGRVIAEVEAAERGRGNSFDRSELFLAWEFTVASQRNLTERVLHIRDDAFAQLGDVDLADEVVSGVAPRFEVTEIRDRSGDGARLREVHGFVEVPNYLDRPPMPPFDELENDVRDVPGQSIPQGRFLYGPDGLPTQNPAYPHLRAPFVCTIPARAVDAPAHPYLYGHGLLGSRGESRGGSTDRLRERNFMPCATDWIGMADEDFANAVAILLDPSLFPSLADRAQQGFLNFLYLGRAIVHPAGFASHDAFRDAEGSPLMRTGELVYDGNSQGGIMGGALTALAVDFTRATIGVTGMNYSTLLNRSVDWEGPLFDPDDPDIPSYSSGLYTMFPDKRTQQVVMALMQMLWDRAEANGYAHHMTDDPLPNTPPHQVLMHVAYGDFQVANVSAEVEARTIGARSMDTALGAGRHWSVEPSFGLPPFPRDGSGNPAPYRGSALVYWDSGNLAPPNANVPPALDGGDPHEDPRRDPRSGDQRAHFYLTGEIVDPFGGAPYLLCRPGQESRIPRVPELFEDDWCV